MADIIVNLDNALYKEVTNNRGAVGLGTEYRVNERGAKPNEVVLRWWPVDTDVNGNIYSKLWKIEKLREDFSKYTLADLRNKANRVDLIGYKLGALGRIGGSGESIQEGLDRLFKLELRNILFIGGLTPEVETLSKTWQFFAGANNKDNLASVRRDWVDRILPSWENLIKTMVEVAFSPDRNLDNPNRDLARTPYLGPRIAKEWETFTLTEPSKIYYSYGDLTIEKQFEAGTYSCSNDTFGTDPLPGYPKACYKEEIVTPPPTPPDSTPLPPTPTPTIVPPYDPIYGVIRVDIVKPQLSVINSILSASKELITVKTLQFFDEDREYKTVLNFGLDRQNLIEAWRPVAGDSASVQFKLINPLDDDVVLEESAYITKEFAKSVIDIIDIRQPPFVDTTPYLRPMNMDVGKYNTTKQSINGVTLRTLGLETGSFGQISSSLITYEDKVFNRWYTADYKASELNIDFGDYKNFITFGSAKARLNAFTQKLKKIQQLTVSASLSSSNEGEKIKALEKEYVIRNMDPYEQYLYFAAMDTPYSASAYYVDGGIEYNPTGSWPKDISGKPLSFDNVQTWYSVQSQIADRYDEFNDNRLRRHLPEHIQEDSQSEEFLQFIDMFGHMMDNIKVYIDQFTNIYSTNPNPFEELSMDQVYEVAKSFGMNLPNVYSLETLQTFIESVYGDEGSRALVAETWKRFMHNLPLLYKTKGTRTSLDLLLNIYGLRTPAIQIKESGHPTDIDYLQSDEYSNGLRFNSASVNMITVPFVSASMSASTVQIRFNPTLKKTSTLLHNGSGWAVDIVTHPSASVIYNKIVYVSGSDRLISQENTMGTYGQLRVVSGSSRTVLSQTQFFPLFSDDFTYIMLRSQSSDITVVQTDGDQILFQQSASINWGNLWNTTKIYIGGTSSISVGSFDGIVDEVHIWSNNVSTDSFINQTYDPGSYYGTTYTSPYDSLYVHLGFSQIVSSVTQSIINETPYSSASRIEPITATKFTTSSYEKILRTVKQYVPTVGAMAYSDTKVRVAPPPVFSEKFIDESGTYVLSRTNSIKQLEDKVYTSGLDVLWFAVSPTDFVNQTIIRSMGLVDVNYLIGTPRILRNERYKELDELLQFYQEHYNKNINVNQYIRFYKNLLKAPTEYVKENIPLRTNLLDGIVIESPILDRKRVDIQKTIRVDGANTVTFEKFVTGSGSANVGAYQFDADYELYTPKDTTIITKPILQYVNGRSGQESMLVTSSLVSSNGAVATIPSTIEIQDTIIPVSSETIENIPSHRNFLQNVTTNTNSGSFVISSLTDKGSGIGYVDSIVDATPNEAPITAGYARNPYLGVVTGSLYRVNSEQGTTSPFYAIEPVSNFNDVGTTTYFYTTTGIHWFDTRLIGKNLKLIEGRNIITLEPKYKVHSKQLYKAKFDLKKGEVESEISDLFANITLLDPTSLTDYPGRESTLIQERTYLPSTPYFGVLKIANIFSLYAIAGTPGLRIRLYTNQADQSNDISRPFNTSPQVNVMFDTILPEDDNLVFPYTLIQTLNSTIFFTIENTTGTNITSQLELFYFEYEPSSLVPIGYLPRHYKFTRYEPVAQRRRNYVGCKLTYCPEGCTDDVLNIKNYLGRTKTRVTTIIEEDAPVQIFASPRTSPIVRRTTGGGTPPSSVPGLDGILNVGGKGKLDDKKR